MSSIMGETKVACAIIFLAALLIHNAAAQAQSYRGPTTANDPMYKVDTDTAVAEGLLPQTERKTYMLKSLMLAVACAYINRPGLQPNAPLVQATAPEVKQAYAMKPGAQKGVIDRDGLCSKVMIEPSIDEALNAFIDPDAAKNFVGLAQQLGIDDIGKN